MKLNTASTEVLVKASAEARVEKAEKADKANKALPYGRQYITEEDIRAVVDVLRSDWLTQGPTIERFERAVAEYCGCKFAVATNSATSALHIAALAAGLGNGDRLWTSPNTFVASANCALYCGATVDFVDINSRTYNLSVGELAEKLSHASSTGTLPKVIVPVHFAGQSCEMVEISKLAREYGAILIEDASHGIGGSYRQTKVGSCAYSDMAVFSFHPVKIITTGEGGMVLTNRQDLCERLLLLRSHGITRSHGEMTGASHGPWYYEQIALGYNYRMTDIEAALGISQLGRIDEIVARRQFLAKRYDALLSSLPVTTPWQRADTYSAFHLYVIRLKLDQITKSHRQVFEELRAADILVNLHYIPVHTQPYYQRLGFKAGQFPNAERYYSEAITLPLYFGLTDSEQDFVVAQLTEILNEDGHYRTSADDFDPPPGKILKTVLRKPLLEYQIERLRRVKNAQAIVVATTANATDDIIDEFCARLGLRVFRGSEEDVLGRYYHAAVLENAEQIVRVTSDCPLIDPDVVDEVIGFYDCGDKFDYVSNTMERTYPRGLDAEVFSMKALTEMFREATLKHQREHVTPFIHDHRERYRIGQVRYGCDLSYHRWTVDTAEDFELIRRVLEALYPVKPMFDMQDVLDLFEKCPDWITLNRHIHQKELSGK